MLNSLPKKPRITSRRKVEYAASCRFCFPTTENCCNKSSTLLPFRSSRITFCAFANCASSNAISSFFRSAASSVFFRCFSRISSFFSGAPVCAARCFSVLKSPSSSACSFPAFSASAANPTRSSVASRALAAAFFSRRSNSATRRSSAANSSLRRLSFSDRTRARSPAASICRCFSASCSATTFRCRSASSAAFATIQDRPTASSAFPSTFLSTARSICSLVSFASCLYFLHFARSLGSTVFVTFSSARSSARVSDCARSRSCFTSWYFGWSSTASGAGNSAAAFAFSTLIRLRTVSRTLLGLFDVEGDLSSSAADGGRSISSSAAIRCQPSAGSVMQASLEPSDEFAAAVSAAARLSDACACGV
mmetsp:Transcript_2611/g.6061  ORF Transcript_2611/g.6061 Transcript_2611/m.6061 type:complete len:365 (+) Transcript_2611:339-1433(+)